MKTFLISIIAFTSLVTSCSHPAGTGDGNISPEPAIHANMITVAADVPRAVLDKPITITTTCMPVVTGKGFIGLIQRQRNDTLDRIILNPIDDTVTVFQENHYTTYVPAEFKANRTFTQEWRVQLLKRVGPAGGNYYFSAHIYVDSIFIADSNRMYGIYSEIAQKYCPRPLGWDPYAVGNSLFLDP